MRPDADDAAGLDRDIDIAAVVVATAVPQAARMNELPARADGGLPGQGRVAVGAFPRAEVDELESAGRQHRDAPAVAAEGG